MLPRCRAAAALEAGATNRRQGPRRGRKPRPVGPHGPRPPEAEAELSRERLGAPPLRAALAARLRVAVATPAGVGLSPGS